MRLITITAINGTVFGPYLVDNTNLSFLRGCLKDDAPSLWFRDTSGKSHQFPLRNVIHVEGCEVIMTTDPKPL